MSDQALLDLLDLLLPTSLHFCMFFIVLLPIFHLKSLQYICSYFVCFASAFIFVFFVRVLSSTNGSCELTPFLVSKLLCAYIASNHDYH